MWAASTIATVHHQHVAISKKTMALFWIPLIFEISVACSSAIIVHVFWSSCADLNLVSNKWDKFNVRRDAPSNWKICSKQMGNILRRKHRARDSRDYIKEKIISTKNTKKLFLKQKHRTCEMNGTLNDVAALLLLFFSTVYILRKQDFLFDRFSLSEIYDLHGIIATRLDTTLDWKISFFIFFFFCI